jgi:protein Tex
MNHVDTIAAELSLRPAQVRAALELLAGGNTVPFIARYRKEATGELDEVQVRDVRDRHEYLSELDDRRATILASIEEQGKLTPELRASIERARTKAEVEDLYLPFKPKRRTRATIATERGLGPLAELLAAGDTPTARLRAEAVSYVDPERGVPGVDEALAGARDILAERVAEDPAVRSWIRDLTRARGVLESRKAKGADADAASKFKDYFDHAEPVRTIPGHRVLAVRRGEAEDALTAKIVAPEDEILRGLEQRFVARNAAAEEMRLVVTDAYRRLIAPSVEVEIRLELKTRADEEAIGIFGRNLEALLLSPPAGQRITLGIDPGFRTGCKLAVVGDTGALLETGVIYLHQEDRAAAELQRLIRRHRVALVGIGNGTASRETDALGRRAVRELPDDARPTVVMVNEAGASVYSASDVAREEFPDLDLTLRSAVSIARRLQDPLAELVKIDPKSIGVGQYQHDVSQPRLKRRLDETVESCVNRVGVEVNTASTALLSYVAGIGPTVARRIVEHRDGRGAFRARKELLEVGGLGPKTFEQAAGFLRVRGGAHPLDASAVHPERYTLVERIARDLHVAVPDLVGNEPLLGKVEPARYVGDGVGLPTLEDILAELRKPGRDPREQFEAPAFRDDVQTLEDLEEGMTLEGSVTNVVAFGAFVDVGVHQDGLVHVSEIADKYVSDPNTVVKVGDRVKVRVLSVDVPRRRIALSMRTSSEPKRGRGPETAPRAGGRTGGQGGGGNRPGAPVPGQGGVQGGPPGAKPAASGVRDAPQPPTPPKEGLAPNGMRIRRG